MPNQPTRTIDYDSKFDLKCINEIQPFIIKFAKIQLFLDFQNDVLKNEFKFPKKTDYSYHFKIQITVKRVKSIKWSILTDQKCVIEFIDCISTPELSFPIERNCKNLPKDWICLIKNKSKVLKSIYFGKLVKFPFPERFFPNKPLRVFYPPNLSYKVENVEFQLDTIAPVKRYFAQKPKWKIVSFDNDDYEKAFTSFDGKTQIDRVILDSKDQLFKRFLALSLVGCIGHSFYKTQNGNKYLIQTVYPADTPKVPAQTSQTSQTSQTTQTTQTISSRLSNFLNRYSSFLSLFNLEFDSDLPNFGYLGSHQLFLHSILNKKFCLSKNFLISQFDFHYLDLVEVIDINEKIEFLYPKKIIIPIINPVLVKKKIQKDIPNEIPNFENLLSQTLQTILQNLPASPDKFVFNDNTQNFQKFRRKFPFAKGLSDSKFQRILLTPNKFSHENSVIYDSQPFHIIFSNPCLQNLHFFHFSNPFYNKTILEILQYIKDNESSENDKKIISTFLDLLNDKKNPQEITKAINDPDFFTIADTFEIIFEKFHTQKHCINTIKSLLEKYCYVPSTYIDTEFALLKNMIFMLISTWMKGINLIYPSFCLKDFIEQHFETNFTPCIRSTPPSTPENILYSIYPSGHWQSLCLTGANGSGKSHHLKIMSKYLDSLYFPASRPVPSQNQAIFKQCRDAMTQFYFNNFHNQNPENMIEKANSLFEKFTKVKMDWINPQLDPKIGVDKTSFDTSLSDGQKMVYALLSQICTTKKHFILIDEPEQYLEDSLLIAMMDDLETTFPNKSFIYSTHNVEFVQSRQLSQKIVLGNKDRSKISIIPHLLQVSNSLQRDIHFREIYSLARRRPLVLVEGTTDVDFLSKIAPSICFLATHGCSNGNNISKFCKTLELSSINSDTLFVLLDKDFSSFGPFNNAIHPTLSKNTKFSSRTVFYKTTILEMIPFYPKVIQTVVSFASNHKNKNLEETLIMKLISDFSNLMKAKSETINILYNNEPREFVLDEIIRYTNYDSSSNFSSENFLSIFHFFASYNNYLPQAVKNLKFPPQSNDQVELLKNLDKINQRYFLVKQIVSDMNSVVCRLKEPDFPLRITAKLEKIRSENTDPIQSRKRVSRFIEKIKKIPKISSGELCLLDQYFKDLYLFELFNSIQNIETKTLKTNLTKIFKETNFPDLTLKQVVQQLFPNHNLESLNSSENPESSDSKKTKAQNYKDYARSYLNTNISVFLDNFFKDAPKFLHNISFSKIELQLYNHYPISYRIAIISSISLYNHLDKVPQKDISVQRKWLYFHCRNFKYVKRNLNDDPNHTLPEEIGKHIFLAHHFPNYPRSLFASKNWSTIVRNLLSFPPTREKMRKVLQDATNLSSIIENLEWLEIFETTIDFKF